MNFDSIGAQGSNTYWNAICAFYVHPPYFLREGDDLHHAVDSLCPMSTLQAVVVWDIGTPTTR